MCPRGAAGRLLAGSGEREKAEKEAERERLMYADDVCRSASSSAHENPVVVGEPRRRTSFLVQRSCLWVLLLLQVVFASAIDLVVFRASQSLLAMEAPASFFLPCMGTALRL